MFFFRVSPIDKLVSYLDNKILKLRRLICDLPQVALHLCRNDTSEDSDTLGNPQKLTAPLSAIGSGAGFKCARALVLLIMALWCLSSCTIVSHSPYLVQKTSTPLLEKGDGLVTGPGGNIPYQKWRVPPWDDDMRYIWFVGDYDFRKTDQVEIILYFHGMHSKDYYTSFKKELETLAANRPHKPFVFVGFVDTPYVLTEYRSKGRWAVISPQNGARPEVLFRTVNRIFKALKARFPNIRKDKTSIALTGFSGGGRVLHSVGSWLTKSDKQDPYAEIFRSRLSKIVYFDCWFERDVIDTIPALLENNPGMKIVGTVHMKKPVENAVILAQKYKMRGDKEKNQLVGLNGRLVIYKDDSHWRAMIDRLREAL